MGCTSAELVVGAVTAEVVTLAEHSAVYLLWVFSFLALTRSTDTFSIVAADARPIILAAVRVQIVCQKLILAALT